MDSGASCPNAGQAGPGWPVRPACPAEGCDGRGGSGTAACGVISIQAHDAIIATTNAQKIQNTGVRPLLIVSPAADACAGEIPNSVGEVVSPTVMSAEIAWATIGMIAPASSAAPYRIGLHSAAMTTTATSTTITTTSPTITGAGFANALPRVMDSDVPDAVRST